MKGLDEWIRSWCRVCVFMPVCRSSLPSPWSPHGCERTSQSRSRSIWEASPVRETERDSGQGQRGEQRAEVHHYYTHHLSDTVDRGERDCVCTREAITVQTAPSSHRFQTQQLHSSILWFIEQHVRSSMRLSRQTEALFFLKYISYHCNIHLQSCFFYLLVWEFDLS